MRKNIFFIVMLLFCAFMVLAPVNVKAYESSNVVYSLDEAEACKSIFGDPDEPDTVAHFLEQILTVIQYAGPVLCLVLSVADFVKAAANQDKDALMKAAKTTGKRIMFAMILFFIPLLIDFLFPRLGWYGTCDIG